MFGIMLFTVHVPGLVSSNVKLYLLDVQTRHLNENFDHRFILALFCDPHKIYRMFKKRRQSVIDVIYQIQYAINNV